MRSATISWLTAEITTSPRQASMQRAYYGWLRLRSNPLAMFGVAILFALLVLAAIGPWIAPYGFNDQDLETRLLPPSAAHWFGTDELGRDILSRIIYGARITLEIAVLVAVIAAPIGLLVGTTAGYLGGWADTVLMRINDIFLSVPGLILALGFVAA